VYSVYKNKTLFPNIIKARNKIMPMHSQDGTDKKNVRIGTRSSYGQTYSKYELFQFYPQPTGIRWFSE
jgi:hypothetical protein